MSAPALIPSGSMIEAGLYKWATTNDAITKFMGNADAQRKLPFQAFYFSFLPKNRIFPCVALDRLKSPNAAETLDPASPSPGQLIEGHFQFGSFAEDDPRNPILADGYLSACLLSQAMRRQLQGLGTGNTQLPDGTLIQDVEIVDEYDAHYELGGTSYLLRRVVHARIVFREIA